MKSILPACRRSRQRLGGCLSVSGCVILRLQCMRLNSTGMGYGKPGGRMLPRWGRWCIVGRRLLRRGSKTAAAVAQRRAKRHKTGGSGDDGEVDQEWDRGLFRRTRAPRIPSKKRKSSGITTPTRRAPGAVSKNSLRTRTPSLA
ncbi:hypothetical protein L873DRAFT_811308 [Choiromyces venosus 120613-1]|uniref:Uncharacterized protein n=1 Tax=Choiromyces venosus 120613-1 TaxID=1336337 RepID=A0A3N4K396_9PEZI|nr:hypothetical protein L873DRAFT_811308 [Choiromyces venosus 120613-1]